MNQRLCDSVMKREEQSWVMHRETSFVSSGAESLVWTEMESKEMFQRHRLWVTYIGTALDPDKQHKGVPPVYLWPEQKRLLRDGKGNSQQQEGENVNDVNLVSDIDNGLSKKRKYDDVETDITNKINKINEINGDNNDTPGNDNDNEATTRKRPRMSWFGDTLNMLQQHFFNTIGKVYNWFQQSLFGSYATTSYKIEEIKKNDAYMSTEDVNFSIFIDLRSRGYFVGPGDVYGGDFNIYKGGDPSNSHSAATIRVVRKNRIAVRDLLSFSRVQNHVAKSAVFSFIEPSSNKPAYLIANFRNVSDRL